MRSPWTAVLWECWRLTRVWLVARMLLIVILGAPLLVLGGRSGAAMLLFLAFFIAGIGRSIDFGTNPRGFPMILGFSRPIRTGVLVGIPMAYIAVSSSLTYLLPVAFLRMAFDVPLPLLPVAALIVMVVQLLVASQWWTGGRRLRIVALLCVYGAAFFWYDRNNTPQNDLAPERWADLFAFSVGDYAVMAIVVAIAVGLTIYGVDRQRHGEDGGLRTAAVGGRRPRFSEWLSERFRTFCPTSSPALAQIWFEAYTVGAPVLRSAIKGALVFPVLAWLAHLRPSNVIVALVIYAPLFPLLFGLRTMLGIRQKDGASVPSAFAMSRPLGTVRLLALKIAVKVVVTLVAWALLVASLWATMFLAGWETGIADYVADLFWLLASGRRVGALVLLVVLFVAGAAVVNAFYLLHPRRVVYATIGVGLYVAIFAFVANSVDGTSATVLEENPWLLSSQPWLWAGVLLSGIVIASRRGTADGVFSARSVGAGILALLVAGWTVLATSGGVGWDPRILSASEAGVAAMLLLVPVAAFVMAPWSLSRIRHQ